MFPCLAIEGLEKLYCEKAHELISLLNKSRDMDILQLIFKKMSCAKCGLSWLASSSGLKVFRPELESVQMSMLKIR